MSRSKSDKNEKEHERFYLLPGMGGRPLRRKRKIIFWSSIIAGLVFAVILGAFLYWLDSVKGH
jgi:hypothetical protein